MKTKQFLVLNNVTPNEALIMGVVIAIASILSGVLVGLNHRPIIATLDNQFVNQALAAPANQEAKGTMDASRLSTSTSALPQNRKVKTYTVVSRQEQLREQLSVGIYEDNSSGRFWEVLGHMSVEDDSLDDVVKAFNMTEPDSSRHGELAATVACNAPETRDKANQDPRSDKKTRYVNVCRFVPSLRHDHEG